MNPAIIVITHLWNEGFEHWWNYYFWGHSLPTPKNVWYERAVWGNVFADIPLVLAGIAGYWIHKWITKEVEKFDHAASHAELHRKIDTLLLAMDPDADSNTQLDIIADRVNEQTPGGIGAIRADLKKLLDRT